MSLFFFFRRSGPVAASEADSYHALGAHANDFPLLLVEVAFATDPTAADQTWTDVTDYVRAISIRRGRDHELQRAEAGTLSVLLDNRDRRFDPTYTSGAYYPNVLPMRQIRVRAYWDGTVYDLYRGFVEQWPQAWPEYGKDAVVEVTAFDALGTLALQATAGTLREAIVSDDPAGYWRLGETDGAVAADSSGNGVDGVYVLSPTQGADSLLQGDANPAVSLDGEGAHVSVPDAAALDFGNTFTVEAWINADTLTPSRRCIVAKGTVDEVGWAMTVNPSTLVLELIESDNATVIAESSVALTTGTVHHCAITKDGATTRVYVDGEDVTVAGTDFTIVSTTAPLLIGVYQAGALGFFDGTIDEVAVYPTALPADRIAAHYLIGSQTSPAETAASRIGRYLDLAGWPTELRDLDEGATSPLAAGSAPSGSVLDAVQTIAEAETGLLYASAGGTVVFADRTRRWLANADGPAAVLGDGGGSEIPIADLVAGYTVDTVRNHVAVTPAGGTAVTASDAASQAAYYRRSLDLAILSDDQNEAESIAQGLLGRFKDPAVRVDTVTMLGGSGTAIWPHVLGAELGARYTIRRRPPAGGTIETDVYLEAVSHDLAPGPVWQTSWQLSPADGDTFWILDDNAFGVLGETTRLAY